MPPDRLASYARLPRAYREVSVLHSTVDAFGRAHWLLRDKTGPREPYDALVVTVEDGRSYETHLSSVRPRFPMLDALPDGGFVVADIRSPAGDDQLQVFDALGRPSWSFRVGDGIEHLLTDESGNVWVGYFDEGVCGDPLSEPGARCWSSTGTPLWEYRRPPGTDWVIDCYALNVDRRAGWVYPYTDFPLVEVRDGRPPLVRTAPAKGASGVAVHGDRVAFFGGYQEAHDRLITGRLTETAVVPLDTLRLTRPDGTALTSPRRVVSRGPRIYIQEKPFTEWTVLDIS